MSSNLLATNPSHTTEHPGASVIAGNDVPTPTPSPAEVVSTFFPSDAGGVGYLFEHGVMSAVPTPLEDTPVNSPNQGAIAMAAVSEGYNAHVSPMPDVPTPVAGGASDVPLGEASAAAPQQSSFMATLAQEGARVKALFAGLGGKPSG
jgi:hypothetical protein